MTEEENVGKNIMKVGENVNTNMMNGYGKSVDEYSDWGSLGNSSNKNN